MLFKKQTVRHILMGRFCGPWMPGSGEIILRHVKTGDDLHHSRNLFRFGRVDGLHIPMGDRRVQHLRHISIFVAQIVRVLCAAGHFLKCIYTLHTLPDHMTSFSRMISVSYMAFLLHIIHLRYAYGRLISFPFTYFALISRSSAR